MTAKEASDLSRKVKPNRGAEYSFIMNKIKERAKEGHYNHYISKYDHRYPQMSVQKALLEDGYTLREDSSYILIDWSFIILEDK